MPDSGLGARLAPDAFAHFEHLTQSVVVTDVVLSPPGPRILYANPTFERMTGWSRDEIIGRTPRILQGPETDRALMGELKAALKRGESWAGETTNYRRDGTPFIMKWTVAPVRDADGMVQRYVAIQEDVTKRRQLEQALLDAKRDAETANEAKSRFLSTMGHELRTPLNAINGFSQLIVDETFGPVGSPQYREYAQLIWQSGEHLLDVINTILDATRVESGRMELADDWFAAPAFMRQTVELARAESSDPSIQVLLNGCPMVTVLADRCRLRQALLNLIGNAIKFSPVGSTVSVEAVLSSTGELDITVRDDGPGIPADAIDRVILPFYQADDGLSRRHEGSGLGLYLTKSFLDLHGGDLLLESALEGGTLATLKLPPSRVRRG